MLTVLSDVYIAVELSAEKKKHLKSVLLAVIYGVVLKRPEKSSITKVCDG